ncbi:cysteine--tRNA ligase [Fusibacter ferrireducens]|uniref:Cysteine--tRNA ligase n=1 Tax=Fusibacter ferrireducens TaxID=2785058 RepID=A0ABR9ZNV7_9FIRM|nr:cysteine--tRNA ligase [Fusibacter ferrireducens]MBF4692153.1 cysteine--tRNA ligase [Fusibacter ferrireducens]
MKLYNTLSRTIEDFKPLCGNEVKIYTCGPTVYNYAHIGNLRTYIHEDILVKSLEFLGFDVKRAMNITDVGHLESDADDGEDKMLAGAKRENKSVWEISEYYTNVFFEDCAKLNIRKPKLLGKATDYIAEYIEFIKVLEAKGYTYFTNGNVYFDISKFDDYTKLSGMNLDELQVALREGVEIDVNKRNPQDFVLWFTKSKFDNQAMKWESPWGIGYPGWHLECSVISLDLLGEMLDIHCGGVDHVAIHHTNEIAQTESYTGKKWVNNWWHGEFLIDQSGKMSKSKGEFLTVSLLEKKNFNPLAYRYYVLNSHYRKPLAFSFESLEMASSAYKKLKNATKAFIDEDREDAVLSDTAKGYLETFRAYLSEDLNTANAITVLYEVLKSKGINSGEKYYLIKQFDQVLSLNLLEVEETIDDALKTYVEEMITRRIEAKKAKNYALADQIRDELKAKGISLKDTATGTEWAVD